jgi:hypothetical protein
MLDRNVPGARCIGDVAVGFCAPARSTTLAAAAAMSASARPV